MRTGLRSPLRTGVRTGGKLAGSLLSPMPAPFAGSAIRRHLYPPSRGCRFDARCDLALAANCDPLGAGEATAPRDGRPVTESGLLTEPLLDAGEAARLSGCHAARCTNWSGCEGCRMFGSEIVGCGSRAAIWRPGLWRTPMALGAIGDAAKLSQPWSRPAAASRG